MTSTPDVVTISSIVAGEHTEGDRVTVAGAAVAFEQRYDGHRRPWLTFFLNNSKTAVKIALPPEPYDAVDGEVCVTHIVTVTGRITRGNHLVPYLVADEVTCDGCATPNGGDQ